MKKIITVFLAVLLLTAVLGTVAMAGLSKSDIVEITGAVDENGDPVEITVRGYELSLRKADTEIIEIE